MGVKTPCMGMAAKAVQQGGRTHAFPCPFLVHMPDSCPCPRARDGKAVFEGWLPLVVAARAARWP
eukprot:12892630-Prorocentrum_lima.AAC.1